MAAIDLNLNPSSKQLRQFGWIALFALPLLGWLLSGKPTPSTWSAVHTQRIGLLALLGVFAGMAGWLRPNLLKWIFVGLSVITFPLGFVLGELILMTVFTIAFLPLALLFRIVKRDALQRRLDRDSETYWQAKATPKSSSSYYRQS